MMEMHSKIVLHCSLRNTVKMIHMYMYNGTVYIHSSENGMNVPIIYMGHMI